MTRRRTDPSRVQFKVEARDFSLLQKYPDQGWDSISLLFNAYRGSRSGLKQPGRKVDQPLSPSAEVKNEWRYALLPLYAFTASRGKT
jgi:hypothetical protein